MTAALPTGCSITDLGRPVQLTLHKKNVSTRIQDNMTTNPITDVGNFTNDIIEYTVTIPSNPTITAPYSSHNSHTTTPIILHIPSVSTSISVTSWFTIDSTFTTTDKQTISLLEKPYKNAIVKYIKPDNTEEDYTITIASMELGLEWIHPESVNQTHIENDCKLIHKGIRLLKHQQSLLQQAKNSFTILE